MDDSRTILTPLRPLRIRASRFDWDEEAGVSPTKKATPIAPFFSSPVVLREPSIRKPISPSSTRKRIATALSFSPARVPSPAEHHGSPAHATLSPLQVQVEEAYLHFAQSEAKLMSLAGALDEIRAETERDALRRKHRLDCISQELVSLPRPVYKHRSMRLSRIRSVSDFTKSIRGSCAGVTTPRRRAWLGQLFRWAVGRVLHANKIVSDQRISAAKKELHDRRQRRTREMEFRKLGERRKACAVLFSSIRATVKASGSTAAFNAAKFAELKALVTTINSTEVLSLSELVRLMSHDVASHAKFDVQLLTSIFRKLDTDRSGYLELDELVRGLYPEVSNRDLRTLRDVVDAAEKDRNDSVSFTDAQRLLNSEYAAEIKGMFQSLDRYHRGFLTFDDFSSFGSDKETRAIIGIDLHFVNPQKKMSLEEFTELIKYAFPPFCSAALTTAQGAKKIEEISRRGLPELVLKAQAIATSSVD